MSASSYEPSVEERIVDKFKLSRQLSMQEILLSHASSTCRKSRWKTKYMIGLIPKLTMIMKHMMLSISGLTGMSTERSMAQRYCEDTCTSLDLRARTLDPYRTMLDRRRRMPYAGTGFVFSWSEFCAKCEHCGGLLRSTRGSDSESHNVNLAHHL